ncbi:MAG TPA: HAD family hydrolase [Gemmatimonadota bacterium]|nr:HAD family hydrolase [Gemmatimonadota bacterium]
MCFRAVIFDLDGTLADTLDDITDAMNHALARHALPTHPREAYGELVGEGVRRLVERALPPDREDLAGEVLEELARYYVDHMLDRTAPYPEVPELLDRLSERGIPMAVLSNKPEPATRWMIDRLFGGWTFAAIVGGADGVPLKPDPAALLAIAHTLAIEPARCVFLGDTRTDMETAVAAGMFPAGALWGFRDRAELEAHGARALLERPLDLLDLFDGATARR